MNKPQIRFLLLLCTGIVLICGAFGVQRYQNIRLQHAKEMAGQAKLLAAKQQLSELRSAVAAAPNDPRPHRALLQYYKDYGLTAKIAEEAAALSRLTPQDADARMQLADLSLAAKKYIVAEASYRAVTKLAPTRLQAWQGLAAALYFQKRYLEGMSAADHAMKLKPDDANSDLILASCALYYALEFPDPLTHGSELTFARKELEGLTKVFPQNSEIYFLIGRACIPLHDRAGAIGNLRRAVELAPNNQDAWRMLIIAYRASDDRVNALKVAREAIVRYPDTAAFNDLLGQILQASGEPGADKQALELFKKAVRAYPDKSLYLDDLGTAFMKAKQNKEALSVFGHEAHVDPNNPYVFQQLAAIYTRLGDKKRAMAAAHAATQLTANEQQLKRLEEIVKHHPEAVPVHLILADRYRDMGRLSLARDEFYAILQLDPNNRHAQDSLQNMAETTAHK